MSRHISQFLLVSLFSIGLAWLLAGTNLAADATPEEKAAAAEKGVTQGALRIIQPDGGVVECPLKHTDVQAEVAGFIARVRVEQTFHNPTKEKIEAVYVFPLPHEAAVDEMTMVIGERKIVGQIKRRAEARSIYEQALLAGQTAALLEQERPNIFTQSIGNIEPGQEVKIQIAYVDVLRYDMGTYEFHFPMVVGPRYIPGTPSGGPPATPAELQGKVSPPVPDTDRVPDASRISPPVLKPGVRNGHDISLSIKLDAGVPIQNLKSANHEAEIKSSGERTAAIKLAPADSLPNKDFVLRYAVVGKKPEMAMLAHTGDYSPDRRHLGNGYFMLMIQPKEDERLTKSPPREVVFLVDVSGSMSGEPTNKVIEAMQGMLKLCRPQDTVQVITFASQAFKLFEKPLPVNDENIGKALGFTAGLQGRGGTEMIKGVRLAIEEPIDKERLRIVVMLTDGYIGNEAEIIEHVGKHCGDQIRFWCVGIGSSPNMFLVDGVAKQGGGMGKKLGLPDETQPLVQEIMTRIQRAQLAKVHIDWGGLKVSETFPAKIPELWAGRPVIVYGRYAQPVNIDEAVIVENITVRGNVEGEDVSWPLKVELPLVQPANDVLAKVWSRQKIEDLMQQSYYQGSPAVEEMVTALALDYKLMSQYTSFVAVDTSKAPAAENAARPPRRMLVPVPLPAGTRWEGFFGEGEESDERFAFQFGAIDGRLGDVKESLSALGLRGISTKRESLRQLSDRSKQLSSQPVRLAVIHSPRPASAAPGGGYGNSGGGGGLGGFGTRGGVNRARGLSRFDSFGRSTATPTAGASLARTYYSRSPVAESQRLFKGVQLQSRLESESKDGAALDYTANFLAGQGGKLVEAARKLYDQANPKEKPADREATRRLLTQAYLLDTAAATVGQSDGSTAAQALGQIEDLHEAEVKDWTGKLPQLGTELNLVLRDQSLAEALEQVARAGKIQIELADGSLEDVAALMETGAVPRVSYLDLRHATVAEALDWILHPARLAWWPAEKGLVAGSDRRRGGDSAWIYDVSAIALPLAEDLTKLNDEAKAAAEAQRAADEFLAAVRQSLKADEATVLWFAPGQLLVIGSPERQASAADLVKALQGGEFRPRDVPAQLVDATRKRFASRKLLLAKAQAAAAQYDVALAHEQFSWQLLAAAAAGDVDLEALTELQIAWKSPHTADLLGGENRALALRSLWAVTHASLALPDNQELAALSRKICPPATGATEAALADLAKDRNDISAIGSVIYAGLAFSDDRAYLGKALPLLVAKEGDEGAPAQLRLFGRLLLGPAHDDQSQPAAADLAALAEQFRTGIAGADQVVLAALAARQIGGSTWDQFRAQSRDLLGGQPLPGEVVVLVNRLALPQFKLAGASK